MSCSINFKITDEGKLVTKTKWTKDNPKNIAKFRKFLLQLQSGNVNIDICESIMKFGEKTSDRKNARKILKVLVPEGFDDDGAILVPQDLGQEINE